MFQQQPDQHLPDLRDEGGLTVKFLCKAKEDLWAQKSHISLWAQTQEGCVCSLGVVLFPTQSLSHTLRTKWTFLFSWLEGSCDSVRGKIRTKKKIN